ncbi:hypothetical protein CPC08DRAFT_702175 [Agrocybe pediades]|nr:hypothetical protein CPC08DRAFT_702175 [Agrocybe pediades]
MQQDVLNERLSSADHAPVHLPPGATAPISELRHLWVPFCTLTLFTGSKPAAVVDDEEEELKKLQAEMAMAM